MKDDDGTVQRPRDGGGTAGGSTASGGAVGGAGGAGGGACGASASGPGRGTPANRLLRPFRLAAYVLWVAKEVLTGTWDVISNLFRPGPYGKPMIVELPLRCVTDVEITMMASSITITPGTLVVATGAGTQDAPATLFVHAQFGDSEDEVLDGLYDMEDRLLRAMRGRAPGGRP